MNKTILVIYTDSPIKDKREIGKRKKYSFNTNSEVKEGDMISTPEYTTKLQVVKVLDQAYTYYNGVTGDLSNDFTSTSQWTIRQLELRDEEVDVIYGKLVE